ncbi:hypothetical protein [Nannocystis punicea]|uniref:Uncharacterized protein n=1 Tax=Nannocystis punicea TaxID=2995304 RepID=A0ABY7H9Y2_9BACT|nr:hypothetical protein [Nannocystis poenicansa]WAS96031.1 hypothetical protein O0S08_07690 [Nannocystis poenicansa]
MLRALRLGPASLHRRRDEQPPFGTTSPTISYSFGFEPTTVDSSASATTDDGESLCQAFCDRLIACGLGGAFDGCPCTPAEANATCFQEWKLTVECFEFDTCESLESGVSPCWKDFTKAAICGDDSCEISQDFGGDVPVDGCAFSQECLEALNRRLVCDQAMCLCEIDGMPVAMGTCWQSSVCRDAELAAERIENCCA